MDPWYCVKRTILSSILSIVIRLWYYNCVTRNQYIISAWYWLSFTTKRVRKACFLAHYAWERYLVEPNAIVWGRENSHFKVCEFIPKNKKRSSFAYSSLVDNFINYIYNCRFIRISSLLFERIIREANDIYVVQNTMIIIL